VVYEQIGMGGMAVVHRAETQGIAGFSKQVALKRMLPSVASDGKAVQSFIREARLASHLRHANVAQTYDLGKVGEIYFIAMELIPGRNLREILKHCAMVAGHMPLPIAMNIVNQIADALDYAHNLCDESGQPLGIIHRDVSPSNVIVSEGGVVKLIDFGIAKASASSGMQTMSGAVKGKFSYMAPECLLGHVDARSDLFALGVIAHELLSNRPLFQGTDDMDTLYRVRDMPILPPSRVNPQVPPEIDNIIMTALERDPDRRWQRATAMRQALGTETQRLGQVVLNSQVIEWIDRAFQLQFKEDSEPSIMISTHTMEMAQGSAKAVPDDFLAASDSLATMVKPSGSRQIPAQDPERFDVPTVMAEVDPRLLAQTATSDWNSPSAVETRGDLPAHRLATNTEPAGSPWNSPRIIETR
jgi:serine/threonine-protein kinase